MRLTKSEIAIAVIVLLLFAIGGYFYPRMPERIASHWNAQGQVDGYMSKFWGLFLLPFISFILSLFLILIPKIDPLRANIERFKKYYYRFIMLIILFLFYLYILTILWNSGIRFNMLQFLAPAFGIIFYYCGVLIEKTKRNWFIGIRTPWTLSSENVWDKTHKIGGKLFKLAGVAALLGVFLPGYAVFLLIIPAILAAVYTVLYSYIEYQKEIKGQRAGF